MPSEVMVAILVLVAALVVWAAVAFNRLVRARNLMREGWSGIDVQLRRRRNLVPNLVETVKAYGRHEKDLSASRNCGPTPHAMNPSARPRIVKTS